jgi:hypothetical protein
VDDEDAERPEKGLVVGELDRRIRHRGASLGLGVVELELIGLTGNRRHWDNARGLRSGVGVGRINSAPVPGTSGAAQCKSTAQTAGAVRDLAAGRRAAPADMQSACVLSPPMSPFRHARRTPRWLRAIAGFLALAAVGGCEAMLSPNQYGEVRVTVTTAAGAPVEGVPVTLYTGARPIEYAHTDAGGVYLFERVTRGNYGVLAGLPRGFGDRTDAPYLVQDNIDVLPDARRDIAFTLVPCTGTLTVAVRDKAGRPVAGARVILYDAQTTVDAQATGADGTWRFESVSCGEYGVRLEPIAGYTITAGRGTSYLDGLRISQTSPTISVSFTVTSTP